VIAPGLALQTLELFGIEHDRQLLFRHRVTSVADDDATTRDDHQRTTPGATGHQWRQPTRTEQVR
jgi:hypothetical protein